VKRDRTVIVALLCSRSRLAAAGLVLAVVGKVLITAVFGAAAFGQLAVARRYLAG
jgi:hypothetical protein